MKKITLLFLVTILFLSCKKEAKKEEVKENFPSELSKVFAKHGGINTWRNARTLSFNKGNEVHTADLWSRKTVVQSPTYSLGFDGDDIWVSDTVAYKGNPVFYYNLYFYFYAMPFVLADDGITYEKTPSLKFNNVEYPGIKISYASDKGTSPDDNYIIYYDSKTYQMAWLAYTVTFRSKKPSDKYNLIKYNQWENVEGLVLPKSITWYKKDENGQPLEPQRVPTDFTSPVVSFEPMADEFYSKPSE